MTGPSRSYRAALRRMSDLIKTDPEVAAARTTARDLAAIGEAGASCIDLLAAACERYAARPALADPDPITFGELWRRVVGLAARLARDGAVSPGERVGVAGSGCIDWVIADLACLYLGAISVPLPVAIAGPDAAHILAETELSRVLCPRRDAAEVARALAGGRAEAIAVADDVAAGGDALEPHRPDPAANPLFSIVYTSGSTGRAKGVLLPESRWLRTLRDVLHPTPLPTITVGYLPLSHMAGRISLYTTMVAGGMTRFASRSDGSTLFDDIRATRPTALTLVPRVSALVFQEFQTRFVRRGGVAGRAADVLDDPIAAEVMAEMRSSFLGDRLCFVTTGAAPTPPEVVAFLERCFEIHIVDTYGSTELGRVTVNGVVEPWIDYRLVDVAELGYTAADRPYPRGELAVRSRRQATGYYNDPDAMARLADADGYTLTGDIVEERAPGRVVWIDRKQSAIRLAQGESVNVTRLEDRIAAASPFIDQIFVHADPARSYLVAVVVPAGVAGDETTIRRTIRAELDRIARAEALARHERIRDFVIETRRFSRERGLLTDTDKPRRPALRAEYGTRLAELYDAIETRQLHATTDPSLAAAPVAERAAAAFGAALGIDPTEIDRAVSFVDLGGDSLAAIRLAAVIGELCSVALPVASLLDPTASVTAVAARIAAADRTAAPTLARIHAGAPDGSARAAELRLDRFLPPALIAAAPGLAADTGPPRIVVLTGASGFLGRFLLLDLLERAAAIGGEVVALVRARSDRAARERLLAGFATEAPRRRLAELAPGHLIARAADLMSPHMGLDERVHGRLAETADVVIHNAALVNHTLDYEHLFPPNVAGTAEAIRLAITARRKPFHLLSTIGVAAGARRRGAAVVETETARALWARRALRPATTDYAHGYVTSKWAAEVLAEDAAATAGLPVTISRCSMVFPSQRFPGELNDGDLFTRLLRALVGSATAPDSFYENAGSGAHYDGLPVDAVARFVSALATDGAAEPGIYHVSSAGTGPEVSLDRVVDWIESAGHSLERRPYAAWFSGLESYLDGLSDLDRQRSLLPLLARWAEPMFDPGGKVDNRRFLAAWQRFTHGLHPPVLDAAIVAACAEAIGRGAGRSA